LKSLPPCPVCGEVPLIERCEPWDQKSYGPPPWYVGCYKPGGGNEHFVGVNGDTRAQAERAWRVEAEKRKT
jgi:hypothetical protein